MSIVFGIALGLALGWLSYAYRTVVANGVVVAAGVALILMVIASPMIATAAAQMELSGVAVYARMIGQVVPDPFRAALPWTALAMPLAHVATACIHANRTPPPSHVESRAEARARVRADMKYSDSHLD